MIAEFEAMSSPLLEPLDTRRVCDHSAEHSQAHVPCENRFICNGLTDPGRLRLFPRNVCHG